MGIHTLLKSGAKNGAKIAKASAVMLNGVIAADTLTKNSRKSHGKSITRESVIQAGIMGMATMTAIDILAKKQSDEFCDMKDMINYALSDTIHSNALMFRLVTIDALMRIKDRFLNTSKPLSEDEIENMWDAIDQTEDLWDDTYTMDGLMSALDDIQSAIDSLHTSNPEETSSVMNSIADMCHAAANMVTTGAVNISIEVNDAEEKPAKQEEKVDGKTRYDTAWHGVVRAQLKSLKEEVDAGNFVYATAIQSANEIKSAIDSWGFKDLTEEIDTLIQKIQQRHDEKKPDEPPTEEPGDKAAADAVDQAKA